MTNQIYECGDATEGIMAIAYIRQSPEILKVFDILYYDPDAEDLRVGARTPNLRGSMRRLLRVLGQFYITYYLTGMGCAQILALLPSEFDDWLAN